MNTVTIKFTHFERTDLLTLLRMSRNSLDRLNGECGERQREMIDELYEKIDSPGYDDIKEEKK